MKLKLMIFFLVFISACAGPGSQVKHAEDQNRGPSVESGDLNLVDQRRNEGLNHYENSRLEDAMSAYQWVVQKKPDDSDSQYKLGVIYNKKGMIEKSRSAFLKVIFLDPKFSKAYYNLGVIYSNKGSCQDIEKSIFFFKKYLNLEPSSNNRQQILQWIDKHKKTSLIEKPNQSNSRLPEKEHKEWLREQAVKIGSE